jgi:hypothetical protein
MSALSLGMWCDGSVGPRTTIFTVRGSRLVPEAPLFCLLFFGKTKKSRCRPAQGQRLRREAYRGCPRRAKQTKKTKNQPNHKNPHPGNIPIQTDVKQ